MENRNRLTFIDFILCLCCICSIILLASSSNVRLKDTPKNVRVLIGQPAVLRCRLDIPSQVDRIKLQWSWNMFGFENSTLQDYFKGRISIPGSIESGVYDLHFKTTESSDQAIYACHVEIIFKNNTVESLIGKGYMKIIVPPKQPMLSFQRQNGPSFVTLSHPQESTIWGVQDEKLNFSCTSVGGHPQAQLSWLINGKREGKFTKLNTSTVSLSSELDHSNLSCYIKNENDYLGVKIPPAIVKVRVLYFNDIVIRRTNGNLDQPIQNGESVSFTCSSENTPKVIVYYSWYITYMNAEKVNKEYIVEKSSSNSVFLKVLPKHHQSKLHCILHSSVQKDGCDKAINKFCKIQLTKNVTVSQPLNVLYPPKILMPFENLTVNNIGDWIILTCDVDSNPPASVKWLKTQIGTSKDARSLNWYFQTSLSNLINVMTIENIISSSSYHKFQFLHEHELDIYICEASSSNYQKAYKYVVVAKEEETSIKVDQQVIQVENDASASLMCLIESWPKPSKSNIKWYYEDSEIPIFSTERRYFINIRQLMGFESKLYFKRVIHSDYGKYTCTASQGSKVISKQIQLLEIKSKFIIYISVGAAAIAVVLIIIIVAMCLCKKHLFIEKRKSKKTPPQHLLLPPPTIDSCIESEIFLNRLNSLQSYQKDGILNDSVALPSNRCFIFHNQQNVNSKRSYSDDNNGQDEKSTTKGKESNRSLDSGVGPDDAVYRNGYIFQNVRGSNYMSPFSTLTSSNNSISQNNAINRYWQSYQPEFMNSQNSEADCGRMNNGDNSNFNGSMPPDFVSPQNEPRVSLIANSENNQSFVCIPVDEYQQHMRILLESQGPSSLRSFSIASGSTNNGNLIFNQNHRSHNGNISPTEVSVKSNSTNSKKRKHNIASSLDCSSPPIKKLLKQKQGSGRPSRSSTDSDIN